MLPIPRACIDDAMTSPTTAGYVHTDHFADVEVGTRLLSVQTILDGGVQSKARTVVELLRKIADIGRGRSCLLTEWLTLFRAEPLPSRALACY